MEGMKTETETEAVLSRVLYIHGYKLGIFPENFEPVKI